MKPVMKNADRRGLGVGGHQQQPADLAAPQSNRRFPRNQDPRLGRDEEPGRSGGRAERQTYPLPLLLGCFVIDLSYCHAQRLVSHLPLFFPLNARTCTHVHTHTRTHVRTRVRTRSKVTLLTDPVRRADLKGILGADISGISRPISFLAMAYDLPQISYSATSPDLSNKGKQVKVCLSVCRLGWLVGSCVPICRLAVLPETIIIIIIKTPKPTQPNPTQGCTPCFRG